MRHPTARLPTQGDRNETRLTWSHAKLLRVHHFRFAEALGRLGGLAFI
jgi:hypothetical protein